MEQAEKKSVLSCDAIACALLGILALGVRLYGIRYGLPFPLKPDEPYIIDSALGNLWSQDPIILGWPGSLLVLSLSVLYSLYYFILKVSGSVAELEDFIFMYWDDPTAFYLAGRVLVATTGAITVTVLYRLCAKLYGRKAALLSSLFLAFAFMHVRHSHFALPDIPMTLLLVIALSLSWRMLKGAGHMTYIAAGALCGLSASLKFNSLVIVFPLLISHLLRESRNKHDDRGKLVALCASTVAFFYIGCPYILTDPRAMLASIREVVIGQKEIGNTRAVPTGPALSYLFWYILPHSTSWAMVILSMIGFVFLLVRPTRWSFVLLSYPVIYVMLLSTSKTLFLRYSVPLIPFMALFSGVALMRITGLVRNERLRRALLIMISLTVLLPLVRTALLFDHMLTRSDTRIEARRWVIEQLPPGSRILLDNVPFSVPMGFREWVQNYEMRGDRWGELKYRYLDARAQEKANSFELMYTGQGVGEDIWDFKPHYVIMSSYVKNLFYGERGDAVAARVPEIARRRRAFYEKVESEGELLMRFAPTGFQDAADDDVYGVAIQPEPGPAITIYRIKESPDRDTTHGKDA